VCGPTRPCIFCFAPGISRRVAGPGCLRGFSHGETSVQSQDRCVWRWDSISGKELQNGQPPVIQTTGRPTARTKTAREKVVA